TNGTPSSVARKASTPWAVDYCTQAAEGAAVKNGQVPMGRASGAKRRRRRAHQEKRHGPQQALARAVPGGDDGEGRPRVSECCSGVAATTGLGVCTFFLGSAHGRRNVDGAGRRRGLPH